MFWVLATLLLETTCILTDSLHLSRTHPLPEYQTFHKALS